MSAASQTIRMRFGAITLIKKLIVSSYQLTHQAGHLANWFRINLDFTKVTPEEQQPS